MLFSFFFLFLQWEARVKMSAGRRSADGSPRFYARVLLCCSFFPLWSRVFLFLPFFFLVSVLLFNTPYACTELLVCVYVCAYVCLGVCGFFFFFCKSPHHQYVLDSKLSLSLGYLISARGITTVFCFFFVCFFFFFLYLHAFRYCCCWVVFPLQSHWMRFTLLRGRRIHLGFVR